MISTAQIAKSAFAPSVFVTSLFGPNMRTKFEKTQPDIATRMPVCDVVTPSAPLSAAMCDATRPTMP